MAETTAGRIPASTDFKSGLQAGVSIAIGYFPIALTFGLLAKSAGLSASETLLMSLIVFAGAAQYISLSLLSLGTGIFEIVLTTFIVNIRHFLMATSLNEKAPEGDVAAKAIYSFGLTDETFSVAATKEGEVRKGYMFGLILISYSSWVVFSGIGHLIGANLPQSLQDGMSVALFAMFIGLLVPSMKGNAKVVYLAVMAAAFNTIFTIGGLLETGWSIVASTLLSAVIAEAVVHLRGKKVAGNEE
ncbi:branched-chain amino acid ABC transporter permease [Bacillus sp. FJAT-27225]|uniref:AzlC family ABC transporter permease n=1 Tax=Bacillus sp. FJAT-27225 TaxID=1743144 RepID=UPI00080C25C3|nr:AzlC family ABC transporter permease [Bacillus sp. FJAT-27225]OCA84331.1 branched-chain amino acid ABC transporter permease [Bacillus sp. FJAT-27225]